MVKKEHVKIILILGNKISISHLQGQRNSLPKAIILTVEAIGETFCMLKARDSLPHRPNKIMEIHSKRWKEAESNIFYDFFFEIYKYFPCFTRFRAHESEMKISQSSTLEFLNFNFIPCSTQETISKGLEFTAVSKLNWEIFSLFFFFFSSMILAVAVQGGISFHGSIKILGKCYPYQQKFNLAQLFCVYDESTLAQLKPARESWFGYNLCRCVISTFSHPKFFGIDFKNSNSHPTKVASALLLLTYRIRENQKWQEQKSEQEWISAEIGRQRSHTDFTKPNNIVSSDMGIILGHTTREKSWQKLFLFSFHILI